MNQQSQQQTLGQLLKNKLNQTSQTQPSLNAPVLQVKNNAGGYVFEISAEKQLDRFLVIGSLGGTFYQSQEKLTHVNLAEIKKLIASNGEYVVSRIVEISDAGRARNNDYALMVLAMCFAYGSPETKQLAKAALTKVARTGTHIMHFVDFAQGMRGWGSSLKKAVANWYNSKSVEDVAYQALKYQSRDGWSQSDLLRLSHPKTSDPVRNNIYSYMIKGAASLDLGGVVSEVPSVIRGFEMAKVMTNPVILSSLIGEYNLSREMIPNTMLGHSEIWAALLFRMNPTAMIRNLNKMTAVGLLSPFSEATKFVVSKLSDKAWLKRGRIHPLQILVAQKIYASGHGDKGSLVWSPIASITQALEKAFYLSFETIEPSGKNRMLAIDVSGSMNSACSGAPQITCREAAAVLAMATVRVEPWSCVYGFDHEFRDLGITKDDSLQTVCEKTYSRRFASTDCAKPMVYAQKMGWKVDQFDVYTDNETYYGAVHPFEAIKNYRKSSGVLDSKVAVVAMTASKFSIANPADSGMIDLVGFDTATPALLADFAAGLL